LIYGSTTTRRVVAHFSECQLLLLLRRQLGTPCKKGSQDNVLIVLLGGGDKTSQSSDIAAALELSRLFKE